MPRKIEGFSPSSENYLSKEGSNNEYQEQSHESVNVSLQLTINKSLAERRANIPSDVRAEDREGEYDTLMKALHKHLLEMERVRENNDRDGYEKEEKYAQQVVGNLNSLIQKFQASVHNT